MQNICMAKETVVLPQGLRLMGTSKGTTRISSELQRWEGDLSTATAAPGETEAEKKMGLA